MSLGGPGPQITWFKAILRSNRVKATVVHIRVTIDHLRVTIFSMSKHRANTTELHPKVRQTCLYFQPFLFLLKCMKRNCSSLILYLRFFFIRVCRKYCFSIFTNKVQQNKSENNIFTNPSHRCRTWWHCCSPRRSTARSEDRQLPPSWPRSSGPWARLHAETFH